MVHHSGMNVMQNLNMFSSKGEVQAHHSQHMIFSQSNWYYNKHFNVGLGAYVQASQFNDPKNTTYPKTLDGIFLCPAPILQGGHQIMNLCKIQFFTRPKLVKIPITDVVINAV